MFLFVELEGDRISLHADAPMEAPTVRGFVSLLIEGLQGASAEDVLSIRNDLIERTGLLEILGMLRVRGLTGVLNRLKSEVIKTLTARTQGSIVAPPGG